MESSLDNENDDEYSHKNYVQSRQFIITIKQKEYKGDVIELDLSYQELTILPDEIKQLKFLVNLDLSDNKIEDLPFFPEFRF